MSNWFNLDHYKQSEFDYCLKLSCGESAQALMFYARYGLALCTHQLYDDAAALVSECTESPDLNGVIELVNVMKKGTLPPSTLEFPPELSQMAKETVQIYLRQRAEKMHKTYKRIPLSFAQDTVGDLSFVQGLYIENDGYLEAVEPSQYVADEAREIDILTRANAELQREVKSRVGVHRSDQMQID